MQFTPSERAQYQHDEVERISHFSRLRKHCEETHGSPLTNIVITSLRQHYVVTGNVGTNTFREKVSKTDKILTSDYPSSEEQTDSDVQSNESVDLATCCGCDAIGQLGHFCTEQECLDSGHIYADPILS